MTSASLSCSFLLSPAVLAPCGLPAATGDETGGESALAGTCSTCQDLNKQLVPARAARAARLTSRLGSLQIQWPRATIAFYSIPVHTWLAAPLSTPAQTGHCHAASCGISAGAEAGHCAQAKCCTSLLSELALARSTDPRGSSMGLSGQLMPHFPSTPPLAKAPARPLFLCLT